MVSLEGPIEQLAEVVEQKFAEEVTQIDAAVSAEVAEEVAHTDREKSSGFFDFRNMFG